MQAMTGDHLIVMSRTVGARRRVGVIVAVQGEDGAPPYVVQWEDQDHTVIVLPGPDARVEHPATA